MSDLPLKVGVIGYGYWGPNLVRNFYALEQSTVTMVAELAEENLQKVEKFYPAIRTTLNASELIESPEVDAVAIATPVSSHHELAKAALLGRKHVFIEKPLARTSEQARDLISLAREHQVVLMVDHTFVYTGAVRKMRELLVQGVLGDLYYFDSARINLGLLQQDINVLWDLATHDLSILLYLIDESPATVQALGYHHVTSTQDEMASLNLNYPSGFHAHIRVSWLSPVKMRLTLLGGSKKMIVYDDVEPSDKLRVYDKGIVLDFGKEEVTAAKPIYRAGDVCIPTLDRTEALQVEAQHFIDCIRRGTEPITGGAEGLAVVSLLEAAERSLAADGAFAPL
ncbi:MAG: Gfo/Idh/MocA family protein [Woeseiaceae bacterium]